MRNPFVLAALVTGMLVIHHSARAQSDAFTDHTELPAGLRGERIQALIDAFNENDSAAVARVMNAHIAEAFRDMAPMEMHVDVFRGAYRQTGGVDFHGIRTYDPPRDETVVIVRDRLYDGWYGLVLRFEGEEERISSIQFSPARPPVDVAGEALAESDLVAEVRAAFQRGCERDAFSGSVLVARREEVLFESACGEANKAFGVPNDVETKFNLGSMNKMFTATAIMKLAEEGRLDLADPIGRYVDESWLPREITDRVTVHHLLTHTSGLGSYFNEAFANSSRALFSELDDYKPLVTGDTLAFEPGTRFGYSNTGMLLLGVVIESVTDTSYFDYIREHVYRPAGMTSTDSYSMDEPVPNLAIGYIPAPETEYGWRNNLFEHVMRGGPAGGGFSTARDLHRFAQALTSGRLVSEESLERMWVSHSEAGYGYGFQVSEGPAGRVVGHGGGFPGLNANLDVFVDAGYVAVVLSNYDRAADPLAGRIRELIGRVEPM